MKNICLITTLLTLFYVGSSSQSIEFAPEGAVWNYLRLTGAFGPPVFDQVEVRYTDDIWVDSIMCKRLAAPEGDYYIYQSGDRVYHRRDTGTQFSLLWDFGVMPGDTFITNSNIFEGLKHTFICTGRDTFVENGIPLPRIDLVVYCGLFEMPLTVNPRYGPMRDDQHCPDYLFNTYNYCLVDFNYGFSLLNYADNSFPTVVNCVTSTDNLDKEQQFVTAAPNPSTGSFYLSNLPIGATTRCFDTYGRLIATASSAPNIIDLSNCPDGVYVIEIQKDTKTLQKIKVVRRYKL